MKRAVSNYAATLAEGRSTGEILLLPDGRILAHNLTPQLARLLSALDPADTAMRDRASFDLAGATPPAAVPPSP